MTYLEHWTWLSNGESLVGGLAACEKAPMEETGLRAAWAHLRAYAEGREDLPALRCSWTILRGAAAERVEDAIHRLIGRRRLEEASWPTALFCSTCGEPINEDQACYQGVGGSLHLPNYSAGEIHEDLLSADLEPVTPDDYESHYGCPPRSAS